MKSLTTLSNLYNSLTQNTSTQNTALGKQLINDAHRYLLQKYFSNETSFSITTVGTQSLTLTGAPSSGDISATLTAAWLYYSMVVQVTFSSGAIRNCRVEKGQTSLTWDAPLTAAATTAISVGGLQFYPLPPNYSKLKDLTINIGQLKYRPIEVLTRQEWDDLNVFPYYGDIPNNFYIYPGGDHGAQVGIWPIPSTTGNLITFNYKYRIPDLSLDDYTTPGTLSVNRGGVVVSATGSPALVPTVNQQLESRWVQFAQPTGDNLWYQIVNVDNAASLTLYQPYQGTTIAGATAGTYTIGQMPIIPEDFHDILVYRAIYVYFSSININPAKAKIFNEIYAEKLQQLEEYTGSNTIDVNLGRRPMRMNPNLFEQDIGAAP